MYLEDQQEERPAEEQANILLKRAEQLRAEGQRQAAYQCVVQSLALYRSLEDASNIVRCLIALSYYAGWVDFGDGLDMFDRRSRLAQEALPLARTLGNDALLAQALCSFDPDAEQLQESVAVARKSGSPAILALTLQKWGAFVAHCGDPAQGQQLLQEALTAARVAGDTSQIVHTLQLLALRGPQPHRLACLQEAAALSRACRDIDTRLLLLLRLANIEEGQDLPRRQAWIEEALALCRDHPHIPQRTLSLCTCLRILASLARKRGDAMRAEACEQEARDLGPLPDLPLPTPARRAALDAAYATRDRQAIITASRQLLLP